MEPLQLAVTVFNSCLAGVAAFCASYYYRKARGLKQLLEQSRRDQMGMISVLALIVNAPQLAHPEIVRHAKEALPKGAKVTIESIERIH